ncbi:peptidoglycan D,D-transpeptidase FtsI family protein [Salinibacillus xinjiangensis]|uniref:serine-type D-Ala-D-Ala carboxypeptidase n=1 Tax=Salinibacillus xinjiangensis TaxID=1229268 RepID=A0A6G1X6P9_9BACI|nr:penicillin-binding protein 2 [Salinibacillus xinjiangensis]MRG86681.1 penicillin-binding protein 2 [Salinibacillus xinjiangensis]
MKKRINVLIFIAILLFSTILYQLADIQLLSTKNYGPKNVNLLERSVAQRSHQMSLSTGRGLFLSRDGEAIGNNKIYDVVMFPGMKQVEESYKQIAKILNISETRMIGELAQEDSPIFLTDLLPVTITENQFKQLEKKDMKGVQLVERYQNEDPDIAQHMIGLVRNNPSLYEERYGKKNDLKTSRVGISGLQKAFDSFLIEGEQEQLLFHVDGNGRPMFGFDLKYTGYENGFYPVKVKTTIDQNLQQKAEELLNKYEINKGGIVLLDVKTRDVLAMASRPHINPNNPYQKESIRNQMLTQQFPGSVFKTVIAAASIEAGLVDEARSFDCSLHMYGKKKSSRDLGNLNFEQSFAESCNRAFGQLGIELMNQDKELIEKYAEKLGLLGPVGWRGDVFRYQGFEQFPEEEQGQIWGNEADQSVEKAIIQTSIGQKNVKVTPLAVANMMATIASNGKKKSVRVVDRILYQNGATMTTFAEQTQDQSQIEPYTATKLKPLLHLVTESGTAESLKGLSVAGKTGTAEMDTDGDNKTDFENYWFGGFFPYEKPKYAMVAVDLHHQPNSSSNIYSVYKDMVQFINDIE